MGDGTPGTRGQQPLGRTGDQKGHDFPKRVAGQRGTRGYAVSVRLDAKQRISLLLGFKSRAPLHTPQHISLLGMSRRPVPWKATEEDGPRLTTTLRPDLIQEAGAKPCGQTPGPGVPAVPGKKTAAGPPAREAF